MLTKSRIDVRDILHQKVFFFVFRNGKWGGKALTPTHLPLLKTKKHTFFDVFPRPVKEEAPTLNSGLLLMVFAGLFGQHREEIVL